MESRTDRVMSLDTDRVLGQIAKQADAARVAIAGGHPAEAWSAVLHLLTWTEQLSRDLKVRVKLED